MTIIRLLLGLPLVCTLSGCIALPIPHDEALTPLYSGTVTDASTGTLIAGAEVHVSGGLSERQPTATTTTDATGHFQIGISNRAHWFFLYLGPADGICRATLTVTATGYQSFSKQFSAMGYGGGKGPCSGRRIVEAIALQPATS
jgi:hypothetical protein